MNIGGNMYQKFGIFAAPGDMDSPHCMVAHLLLRARI